jgi:gliding motility-associated-like protein
MMVKSSLWLLLGIFFGIELRAQQPQPCSGLGQTPQIAFPVCGTTTFVQETVPPCGSKEIPVPGCSGTQGTQYTDLNPYWYKFTCYKSGTLGFTITPNNLGDDYDWQIFDITGHDPSEVFTNPALFVAGNWAGTYGITGASGTATGNIQCASYPPDGVPTFSHWPTLIKGHQYLLIVSHFTSDNQSGYKLAFNGGSASITDTVQPHLSSVKVSCDSKELFVTLNKKMKCISLVSDGSDFKIASGAANVISAMGFNCNSGFDMDSLHLILDQPLPPGQYSLVAKLGTDNNTLLDNCNTPIPDGEQINFEIFPLQPTPMDSVQPLNCKADFIRLIFKKSIQCNSIAADGSDFSLLGPGNISITGATGSCNSGKTDYIDIHLSTPIYAAGNYQVQLKAGIDGNTIIDECGEETPAGATITVKSSDTVSAAINYQVHWGCQQDSIFFQNNGGASITSWAWTFQDMPESNLQNPLIIYSEFGDKKIQLVVSNGVCIDSAATVVSLDNALVADFETQQLLCPPDKASFVNKSSGHIAGWFWTFGDGTSDDHETPNDHFYSNNPLADQSYPVTLVVTDNLGCTDTTIKIIKKLHSCIIAVPNAFTPNGDGINDYLYPLNGFKADNLIFRVYNRYGQLIFETTDWTRKWDGTLGGKPQGTGTYVWTLQYTDRDTGQRVVQKGSSVLIR